MTKQETINVGHPTQHAHPYQAPELIVIGTVQELTGQNFSNDNVDFIFFGTELTGTS
jgi:hypothetical protein